RPAVFASLSESGEHNRTRIVVRRRIGTGRIEIRVLVTLQVDRRQRELIAQTQIQSQSRRDTPVVLSVKTVVGVALLNILERLGGAAVGVPQKKRRERTAARKGCGAWDAGTEKTERILARDPFLSPPVGALALEIVAELQRVLVMDEVEIVLQCPER